MKQLIKHNAFFLSCWLLFIVITAFVHVFLSKDQIHLFFNSFHVPFTDFIFKNITFLGDGWFVLLVAAVLLFVKFRMFFLIGLSYLLSSGITQYLKHFVFDDHMRPVEYFLYTPVKVQLYLVPGVDTHSYNSFPSGHSTTIFALAACFALVSSNQLIKFLLFLMALIVGYSRIYLSQHFLEDVAAGAFVGVASTILVYLVLYKTSVVNKSSWLDNSVLRIKK